MTNSTPSGSATSTNSVPSENVPSPIRGGRKSTNAPVRSLISQASAPEKVSWSIMSNARIFIFGLLEKGGWATCSRAMGVMVLSFSVRGFGFRLAAVKHPVHVCFFALGVGVLR